MKKKILRVFAEYFVMHVLFFKRRNALDVNLPELHIMQKIILNGNVKFAGVPVKRKTQNFVAIVLIILVQNLLS